MPYGTSLGCICSEILLYYKIFLIKDSAVFCMCISGASPLGWGWWFLLSGTELMLQCVRSKQKPCPGGLGHSGWETHLISSSEKVSSGTGQASPNWIDYESGPGMKHRWVACLLDRRSKKNTICFSARFFQVLPFVIRTLENKARGLLLLSFL